MKKITESQLKDKVNSLREYLKVYENKQVDEWALFDPTTWGNGRGAEGWFQGTSRDDARAQDAAKNSTAGANTALVQHREQLAPGSVASETGKDGVTYAVDAKGMRTFKIENGKWVAMNPPVPTEQPELMGAPADQAASVTPAAPTSTQVQTDDNGNHMITTPDGKTMVVGPDGKPLENGGKEQVQGPQATKIAKFKALIAKAKEKRTDAEVQASKDLGGFMGESTTYFLNKLRLIESRQLNEVLSAEEQKEMDALAVELGQQGAEADPELSALINDYNSLKQPAQAAAVTTAKAWPTTREAIIAFQKSNGLVPDGLIGRRTYTALTKQGYSAPVGFGIVQDRPGQNQGASTRRTAPELTQTQQNLTNYGMYKPGDELRTPAEIAASASLADATPNPDAGLEPSDPRHSGYAAWKKKQDDLAAAASQNAPDGVNNTVTRQVAGTRGGPNNNGRLGLQPRRQTQAESVGYNELQRIVSLVNHR